MVHVQALPLLSMLTNSPVCSGDTLKLSTNSANGATSYSWAGPGTFVSYAQNPFVEQSTIAASGTYTVTVALNGCFSKDTITAMINQTPEPPQVTDTTYCQGAAAAALTPNGFGYMWYSSVTGGTGTVTPPTPSTAQPGTSTFYVSQTASNCESGRAKVTVVVDPIENPVLDISDSVVCKGADVLFTATGVGNEVMRVVWNFGPNDSLVDVNPARHSFDHPNTPDDEVTVSATAYYKTCPVKTISRLVKVFDAPNVYLGPDTTICPGGVAFMLRNINASTASGVTWKWSTGETGSAINITAPGTYYVRAGINGCYSTDTLVVSNDCYINYPNVFSPNGDGLNDYFFPRNLLTKGLNSFKLDIYNRWGQLVFTTNTLDGRGWDGKFNDVAQPEGVYVYNIDATFKDGQKEHHTGNVTLLR